MFGSLSLPGLPAGRRLIAALVLLAFLVALLPTTALATNPRCLEKYYVRKGDTLKSIAADFNLRWTDITTANQLSEPYALYVGQRLCIPSEKVGGSAGKTPDVSATDFTVSVAKKTVTVKTTNFPKEQTFFIKLDDARQDSVKWYKVGVFRTKKTGAAEASFALPKDLTKTGMVFVCLKNVYTNAIACKSAIVFP